MTFSRSEIFKSAWANADEVHANFVRNQRRFGTPKPLRACFSQALREAWVDACRAAARARHIAKVKARFDAMPSAAKVKRIHFLREQIALHPFRNISFAPRIAALQSELALLAS